MSKVHGKELKTMLLQVYYITLGLFGWWWRCALKTIFKIRNNKARWIAAKKSVPHLLHGYHHNALVYSIFVVVVVVQFIWQPCSDCEEKIRKNNDVCEPTSVFAGVKLHKTNVKYTLHTHIVTISRALNKPRHIRVKCIFNFYLWSYFFPLLQSSHSVCSFAWSTSVYNVNLFLSLAGNHKACDIVKHIAHTQITSERNKKQRMR